MSENITHTAVCDDLARLCLHSDEICAAFKLCFKQHLDSAHLGGLTRSGGKFVVDLIAQYSADWDSCQPGDLTEEKLAFMLGWLCHRAADLQMKPIFRTVDADSPYKPTECSVYHDAFLFGEVYGGGQVEPYDPATLKPQVSEIETMVRGLVQRALIAMHTFIPDEDNVDGWLEQLFKTRQRFYVDLGRYAEAFVNPDPDKTRRFINEVNFYDRQDPIIRLVRSLQKGTPDTSISPVEAVDAAATQSQYAQALHRGYVYLRATSLYFEGKIDAEAFKDALERGKQGVE